MKKKNLIKEGDLIKDDMGYVWRVSAVYDWWVEAVDPETGRDPRNYVFEEIEVIKSGPK